MFLVGIFQWWYGPGWLKHVKHVYTGILKTADFFSIGLLAKTLFSPFKQISAGRVKGPLPVQLKAWADRLFSRIVGGFIRTATILFGMLIILLRAIWAVLSIILWTILPITPIIGLILWIMGVTF